MRSWDADYWKPVQTGTEEGHDGDLIRRLAPGHKIHPSLHEYKAPLSPHEAARWENATIRLDDFHLPRTERLLVVEGAGGVLVPLNDRDFMTDLMARLALPIILVTRSTLGTINHTLLTVEALKRRGLAIAGIVMNGPRNKANRDSVEQFSGVSVIAEMPELSEPAALLSHPKLDWRPA